MYVLEGANQDIWVVEATLLLDIEIEIRMYESQFYIQLVFKAPLCITLTISNQNLYLNMWVAYFKPKKKPFFQKKF